MTQEEKFEEAKRLYETANADQRYVLESLFPELKESEDERVRKEIISAIKEDWPGHTDWIAWLEKDEQKPADEVEPKFKVGDIIKHNKVNAICKVISVNSGSYYIENIETNCRIKLFNAEQNFHLWTIQDAKDGDVLCSGQIILLFKKWEEDNNWNFVIAYAGIDISGKLQITNGNWLISSSTQPATKEQCDLLFQKMKESGYEWDGKELKKIEQKPAAWSEDDTILIDNCISLIEDIPGTEDEQNWLKSLKDRVQPRPEQEWSEGDEEHIKSLLERLEGMCKKGATFIRTGFAVSEDEDWLKHLKDRVLQPKQEWSEEDKRKIDRIYSILRQASDTHAFSTSCRLIGDKECIELQDFLKSIALQNTWRPSEEQMNALLYVVRNYTPGVTERIAWESIKTLELMFKDLKKLMEE